MAWFYDSVKNTLQDAQSEAKKIIDENGKEKVTAKTTKAFASKIPDAIRFIRQEPEIIFFALLQWLVIGLSYRLWVQFLDWIPQSVWDAIKEAEDAHQKTDGMFTVLSLLLTAWSFLVVCVASYPLALFSAATVSSVNLRKTGNESTVRGCLLNALHNIDRMWAFTTVDAWITVNRIFERLPKKNDRESGTSKALKEALYYAWKLGTIGILPALVNGRGLIDAGKDSIVILKTRFKDAAVLRFGYSGFCWVVGILAYIGAILYYGMMREHSDMPGIYNFYKMMGVPIFVAVGVVSCLIRPVYMVLLAELYSETVPLKPVDIGSSPSGNVSLILFVTLTAVLLACFFLGDQLGIRAYIEAVAAKGASY